MQHPVVNIQLQAIVCRTSALILYKNITMYSEEYQHIKPFCHRVIVINMYFSLEMKNHRNEMELETLKAIIREKTDEVKM